MTEEKIKQKFKEQYPDFTNGENPLSPYFDIFSYAIELAEQEKDKQIEELKAQNNNLQIMLQAEREVRCNEDYLKKVTELEAQIKKMKHYLNEFMRISVASVEEFEPEFSELVGEVETFLEK